LHGLSDRLPPDDSGSEFLDRICGVTLDRPLAIHRLSQRIHDTPEETFADRYLQQLARGTDFVSLPELRVVA
jgi:hypothetical protein